MIDPPLEPPAASQPAVAASPAPTRFAHPFFTETPLEARAEGRWRRY